MTGLRSVWLATLAAGAVVLAGCGGSDGGTTGPTADRHGVPGLIKPARMLSPRSAPYGGEVIGPVRNGWVAEAGQESTTVYAGGQGYGHADQGLLLISRHGGSPRTDRVPVPEAGAIKITRAPLGRKVVASAQKDGEIDFTSTNGVTGTLSLRDDTVTLDHARTEAGGANGATQAKLIDSFDARLIRSGVVRIHWDLARPAALSLVVNGLRHGHTGGQSSGIFAIPPSDAAHKRPAAKGPGTARINFEFGEANFRAYKQIRFRLKAGLPGSREVSDPIVLSR